MNRFAVFGDPVSHSKSPLIHKCFGKQVGLDLSYTKKRVKSRDFENNVLDFFMNGGSGLNITLPHKFSAFKIATEYSDEALSARACNTLKPTKYGLYGHNTDGLGLLDDFDRLGWDINGARILILGAGGAVSGCLGPLLARSPDLIVIANRSIEKAQTLSERFGPQIFGIGLDALSSQNRPFDLVINGISAGLSGSTNIELSDRIVSANSACYDLIYGSQATPFLTMCRNLTANLADGSGMLLAQAARSFEFWTGIYPDPFAKTFDFLLASNS